MGIWARAQDLIANRDIEIAYFRLCIALSEPQEARLKALEKLKVEVSEVSNIKIHHASGPSLELEALNDAIFTAPPILPPETKQEGRWSFEPIYFELVPQHLWAYGVTFKADRTLRIKKVTLHFQDGSSITDARWESLDQRNGAVFSKREYLPLIAVHRQGEPRTARRLDTIEILGSAQDGRFEAHLDFRFELPDPDTHLETHALDLIEALQRKLAHPDFTTGRPQSGMDDFKKLGKILDLPVCPNINRFD